MNIYQYIYIAYFPQCIHRMLCYGDLLYLASSVHTKMPVAHRNTIILSCNNFIWVLAVPSYQYRNGYFN